MELAEHFIYSANIHAVHNIHGRHNTPKHLGKFLTYLHTYIYDLKKLLKPDNTQKLCEHQYIFCEINNISLIQREPY